MPLGTIVTSIPPKLIRNGAHGTDCGEEYQRICLTSWANAGYRILSINCRDEIDALSAKFPNVEFCAARRVANTADGRRLVYLADLLEQSHFVEDGLFGIVNADIWLRAPATLAAFLAEHNDHDMSYGQRMDIYSLISPDESLRYCWGFDYFFFRGPVPYDLSDDDFVFGEPWWDYWLPLAFGKSGYNLRPARVAPVAHLHHDRAKWDSTRQSNHIRSMLRFRSWLRAHLPFPGEGLWTGSATRLFRDYDRVAHDSELSNSFLPTQILCLLCVLFLSGDAEIAKTVRHILSENKIYGNINELLLWRLRALVDMRPEGKDTPQRELMRA